MPEILRRYGFVFFFYSREHEPVHVHVKGKGGVAKYELVPEIKLVHYKTFKKAISRS